MEFTARVARFLLNLLLSVYLEIALSYIIETYGHTLEMWLSCLKATAAPAAPKRPRETRKLRPQTCRGRRWSPMKRRMALRGIAVGVLASAMIAPAVLTPVSAVTPTPAPSPKRILSGWLPYWTAATSRATFLANPDLFSDISPFWHNAVKSSSTASGIAIANNDLSSGTRASNLAELKGHGAWVMPSITDGSGRLTMAGVVKNPSKRAALVAQISLLVSSGGYDGIDLDFETFAFSDGTSSWAATRPAWVTFVKALGKSLHSKGKKLSLSVPPIYNSQRNGTSGYWVYDFAGVASSIDKLRIMAYDYSWDTAGPIGGPISWADSVAAYAVSVVPASKVQLGTPTYGRDWVLSKSGTNCPSLGQKVYDSRDLATAINGLSEGSWKRDAASQERYVNYSVTYSSGKCKVKRSAWLPDEATVVARAQLVKKYHLSGLAVWTIGAERPGQWAPIRALANSLGSASGLTQQQVTAKPSKKKVKPRTKISISGHINPRRAGVGVILQRKSNGAWKKKATALTKDRGVFRFTYRPSAVSGRFRVVVVGSPKYTAAVSRSFKVLTLR